MYIACGKIVRKYTLSHLLPFVIMPGALAKDRFGASLSGYGIILALLFRRGDRRIGNIIPKRRSSTYQIFFSRESLSLYKVRSISQLLQLIHRIRLQTEIANVTVAFYLFIRRKIHEIILNNCLSRLDYNTGEYTEYTE